MPLKIYIFSFSETITELICDRPRAPCGGTHFYTCKQLKTKVSVAYFARNEDLDPNRNWVLQNVRNMTIKIGNPFYLVLS